MLTIMRRHAGWGLKVVLGIVALTFIFYFGYSRISGEEGRDSTFIKVGGEEITRAWYNFFYNDEYEQAKGQFQGKEIPEFFVEVIQNQSRQRIVTRNLIRQFAQKLGITVTDRELAESITQNSNFDPVEYKKFLKNFYRTHGFSYEKLLREDLMVVKFQKWAQKFNVPAAVAVSTPETTWTFEATLLSDHGKKKQTEKAGPITLKERHKLFAMAPILKKEDFLNIFSLPSSKTLVIPLKAGDEELRVRLIGKKIAKADLSGKSPFDNNNSNPSLIDFWFREFASNTKVK